MRRLGNLPLRIEAPDYFMRVLGARDIGSECYNWMRDPELLHFLAIAPTTDSISEFRRRILATEDSTTFTFGIFAKQPRQKASGKLVGLFFVDVDEEHRRAHLSCLVGDRSYWGKGVPQNTIAYLNAQLFEHGGIEKVVLNVALTNRKVISYFLGWRSLLETVLKREFIGSAGEQFDMLRFIYLKHAAPGDIGYIDWKKDLVA